LWRSGHYRTGRFGGAGDAGCNMAVEVGGLMIVSPDRMPFLVWD